MKYQIHTKKNTALLFHSFLFLICFACVAPSAVYAENNNAERVSKKKFSLFSPSTWFSKKTSPKDKQKRILVRVERSRSELKKLLEQRYQDSQKLRDEGQEQKASAKDERTREIRNLFDTLSTVKSQYKQLNTYDERTEYLKKIEAGPLKKAEQILSRWYKTKRWVNKHILRKKDKKEEAETGLMLEYKPEKPEKIEDDEDDEDDFEDAIGPPQKKIKTD